MKKRYEIGDKVKLSPESQYYGQSDGEDGEITDFEHKLPEDDSAIYDYVYYYRVRWKNGHNNVYRYTDLMPAEKIIKEEKTLKQQAVERFGFISKDDKFTATNPENDMIIKEENPANWTEDSNSLWMAKSGEGGLCLCKYGEWAERTSLPKNWAVKTTLNPEYQLELLEWRGQWTSKGWVNDDGIWTPYISKDKGIITYEQFLKWVYNPWKALELSDDSIKPGDWVVGWHHTSGYLHDTPWEIAKVERGYAYPVDYPEWNTSIKNVRKQLTIPQALSMEKEWKPKFKIGDRVRAINESHGWGCVDKGAIGTVIRIRKSASFEEENVYFVDFGEHKSTYWKAHESCLELVEESIQGEFVYSPPKLSSIDSGHKLQVGDTPLVRVITINGISSEFKNEQSINLLIHKPKKVKQLKL